MDQEPTSGTDDAALAQAWAAGDEGGYTALVNRYASLVHGRCRRALGVADADDATQAVFLVLARKRSQAAASPALAAWLLTVADFVIRNARRDRGRLRQVAAPELLNELPAPEPAMADIKEHLDACLEQLPTAEREAVRLHHLAGHTLAEVAAHTGVPLSTVHDRVRRGLERLRPLLVRRGVQAVSIAAILVCMQNEAAAATVPAELMVRLRDLAPAGGGAGSTAAPSDRALRWSRPRMSIMTRIAIAGAAVLLLGSTAAPFLLSASESAPPPTQTTVAPPAPAPAPEYDLDPERARAWMTVQWVDGGRTAERLRALPELALLAEAAPGALDGIAGLREARVLVRPDDAMPHDMRVEFYTRQRDLLRLTTEQQVQAISEYFDEQVKQAEGRETTPAEAAMPFLAGCAGWLSFSGPEAMQTVAGILDQGLPLIPVVRTADGWNLGGDPPVGLVRDGNRLQLRSALAPQTPDPLAGGWPASAADLEVVSWFDSGLPGAAARRTNTASLTVTAEGMRLSSSGGWRTAQERAAAEAWPRLDLARFDAVPADAFLACAVPMTVANTARSASIQSILISMTRLMETKGPDGDPAPERFRTVMMAIGQAIRQIDGAFVAWVEPGVPVPTFTIEADMPRAAADALIATFGIKPAADGSITSFAGITALTVGWQDGRLIVTSMPGGIAAIDRSGGFRAQPEVQRAIAAMPSSRCNMCAVLRPTALVDCIAPYVAMAGPEWGQRLAAYEQRLRQSSAYAFITIAGDADGFRLDAAGLLSLVAGGVLGAAAQSPMRIAN